MKRIFLILFLLIFQLVIGQYQKGITNGVDKVFPGAVGFGAEWEFTDDYEVYVVTNLNNSGTGSLRDAITSSITNSGRIVVFNGLSGTITLNSTIGFHQGGKQLYIAGQTSENGIALIGGDWDGPLLRIGYKNDVSHTILRGVMFGRGSFYATDRRNDCIALGSSYCVVDRCTFMWGTDENVQMWDGANTNLTFQNCIVAEAIALAEVVDAGNGGRLDESLGLLIGAGNTSNKSDKISLYNNAYIHNGSRNPTIGITGPNMEIVNNFVYNGFSSGVYLMEYSGDPKNFNLINNHNLAGSETSGFFGSGIAVDNSKNIQLYVNNNITTYRDANDPEWDAIRLYGTRTTAPASFQSLTPFDYPLKDHPTTTTEQLRAAQYTSVGLFARHQLETDMLDDIDNLTGEWTSTQKTITIAAGTIITDSNSNGIPDTLESIWRSDTFGYVNNLALEDQDTSTGSIEANAGKDRSICSGESITLTASGGESYTWNTGQTTASIKVSPTTTKTYSVTASDSSGNTDTDDVKVTVNSVIASAGIDQTITQGESVTLTAQGGGSYLWNTGATGSTITVAPASTLEYTVTVTKNGCSDTDSVRVIVNPTTASINANAGEDRSICSGESITLTASGGESYTWNTGQTTASITVSPTTTKTYSVTASDSSGNTDIDDVKVTVNSVIASAGIDETITQGESVTLTAQGGDSYLWNTGATSSSITVAPASALEYTVTVTKNGCSDTDSVRVIVNPTTASINANAGEDNSICLGESVTLTASGGESYTWNTGQTTASIKVSPTTTKTYSVTASDSSGNTDTDDVKVTVNSVIASAGIDQTITQGESVTLTAQGGDSYLWNTGATGSTITVAPASTLEYTVTVTKNGCSDTDSVRVIVNPTTASINANAGEDNSICLGESVTLTASGGSSYSWNTGQTTASITVSPTTTKTYSVTASDSSGNIDIDAITVSVENCNISSSSTDIFVNKISVYPNPTTGILNINLTNIDTDMEMEMINLNGSLVYRETMHKESDRLKEVDLSKSLVKGVYFVRLFNGSEYFIEKIILN